MRQIVKASQTVGILLALALPSGCAYHHAAAVSQTSDQGPGAPMYQIPAINPEGNLYVVSLGVEQLQVDGGAPFMHLRLAAFNERGAQPWTIEARELGLSFAGFSQPVGAQFAQGSGPTSPLVVAPGQKANLDLWFPLPKGADPGQATLGWRVSRSNIVLAEQQTVFQRGQDTETQVVYYRPVVSPYLSMSWGPGWWWGSNYGWGWGGGWYGGYYPYGYGWGYGGWGYPGYGYRGYGGGHGGGYGGGSRSGSVGRGFFGGGGGGSSSGGSSRGGGSQGGGSFRGRPAGR
jgi:hypothetical protein